MRRRLLLVGMGRVGRPYARAARELGLDLAVLDHPASLAFAKARGVLDDDQTGYPVVGTSTAAWCSALPEVLAAGPVHGVVAFGESHVTAAALIADELGLPGPGLRAAAVSQDKALQRSLFARHGVRQPAALAPPDLDAAAAWAASRYPVIAKPAGGTGSRGVRLVADEAALRAWHGDRPGEPFLVEQYLQGPEYSLECVVRAGALVFAEPTRKTTTDPPYYVELGHTVPAGLPDPGPARDLAAAVARAMGMRDGLMHLEFRQEDTGPHLMEVAVRTPGDHILELHALAHGTDLFAAAIAVALGDDPAIRRTRSGAAAVRFPAAAPGTVTRIEGLPALRRLPETVDVQIDVSPGDRVHPVTSSRDRVATVLLSAADPESLDRAAKTAADLLRIRTDA
ncbi:hypothetical protein GCM10009830_27200 [Glycomyces endophyticus]|uniref:ATP-grasp domain-containing protein n=1 Tax=Glycomyces endophyticus TaxID=480996 RepID=A0ABN2GXU8_9ACTN